VVPVPPTPTPPLGVEVVPGVVGFVAGGVVFVGVLVVGVLVVVGVEVVVGVDVAVVGVVGVVRVRVVLVQSLAASSATVLAPWLRFCESVVLIVEGRLVTALVSAADALLAAPHWWWATAEETESSWLVRLLF
jgi:hypothetical protein